MVITYTKKSIRRGPHAGRGRAAGDVADVADVWDVHPLSVDEGEWK